ncbi:hypothetical protein AAI421_17920 [Rhodococcus aetherivorans]|uniref:hypothetical protein n=1 Tax=Rhodococcus aetherivorans TaxID=191292 RepID=UPI0031E0F896
MSDATEAADAVIGTFDEHQIDGFGPWREVGPEEWSRHTGPAPAATAYFEINVPGAESEIVHMVADRLVDDARPVFDPGAAADRARDAAIAEQLEAGR